MRDLRLLTRERVGDLISPCGVCTFWQTVPRNGHGAPEDPAHVLTAWVDEVSTDWGPPGRVAYVDGEPAGHALLAPARHVPRLAAFPTAPSDPGTIMLLTVVARPEQRGSGLRKALVQAAAKDALRHRVRSIDVIAARPLTVGAHPCVLPVEFLEPLGFRVARDHPAYPRMRLDLRTAVTIRDEAAAAVRRALARVPGVRPVPDTHPDGATRARTVDGQVPSGSRVGSGALRG